MNKLTPAERTRLWREKNRNNSEYGERVRRRNHEWWLRIKNDPERLEEHRRKVRERARKKRALNPPVSIEKECLICHKKWNASRITYKYCSERCRRKARSQYQVEWLRAKKLKERSPVVCSIRGKEFTSRRKEAKVCSLACRKIQTYRIAAEYRRN